MRKKWTTARDAAKPSVGSGAVKGVSIGDSLDAVAKASRQNYKQLDIAVTKLLTDLGKYSTGIKTKNPALAQWIDANLVKPAKQVQAAIRSDLKLINDMRAHVTKNTDVIMHPFSAGLQDKGIAADGAGATLKAHDPAAYKAMQDGVAKATAAVKPIVPMPGALQLDFPKTGAKKKFEDGAKQLANSIRMYRILVAAAEKPDFSPELRYNSASVTDAGYAIGWLNDGAKRAMA